MEYNLGDIILFGQDESYYPAIVVHNKVKGHYVVQPSRNIPLLSIPESSIVENKDNLKPPFDDKDIKKSLNLINQTIWDLYILKQLIMTTDKYDLQIIYKINKLFEMKYDQFNYQLTELLDMIKNKGN